MATTTSTAKWTDRVGGRTPLPSSTWWWSARPLLNPLATFLGILVLLPLLLLRALWTEISFPWRRKRVVDHATLIDWPLGIAPFPSAIPNLPLLDLTLYRVLGASQGSSLYRATKRLMRWVDWRRGMSQVNRCLLALSTSSPSATPRDLGTMNPDAMLAFDWAITHSKQLQSVRRCIEGSAIGKGVVVDEQGLDEAADMVIQIKHLPFETPSRISVEGQPSTSMETPLINHQRTSGEETRIRHRGTTTTLISDKVNTTPRNIPPTLRLALRRMQEVHRLCTDMADKAKTKYDSTNKSHERKLMELWTLMRSGERMVDRISEDWQLIGFQAVKYPPMLRAGKDPATDFRGLGLLGLEQLVYLAKRHPTACQHILTISHLPNNWFPMACTGLNISAWLLTLACTRALNGLVYGYKGVGGDREAIDEWYCYVFHGFATWWQDSSFTVMQFGAAFEEFKIKMARELDAQEWRMLEE